MLLSSRSLRICDWRGANEYKPLMNWVSAHVDYMYQHTCFAVHGHCPHYMPSVTHVLRFCSAWTLPALHAKRHARPTFLQCMPALHAKRNARPTFLQCMPSVTYVLRFCSMAAQPNRDTIERVTVAALGSGVYFLCLVVGFTFTFCGLTRCALCATARPARSICYCWCVHATLVVSTSKPLSLV